MKKIAIALIVLSVGFSNVSGQNNIGIFVGGGFTDLRMITDSSEFNKEINKTEFKLAKAYHGGFNFENILIERKLYLMFGIHAKSSGFSSHNDSVFFFIHNVHIPLEVKYKYFFSRRGEAYVYVSGGPYIAASYKGIKFDQYAIDQFLTDTTYMSPMFSPKIKFGKEFGDDIEPLDVGLNLGAGFGYNYLQIGYNFGFGIRNMIPSQTFEEFYEEGEFHDKIRNMYHTLTVGFYFSNK